MAFAIMRCAKKSSMGAVARSLKHCFRELPTPNADPSRTGDNKSAFAKSTTEAMGKMRELLPEKRRKDAVVAVEYLMTASPEWWKSATTEQQEKFFNRCVAWLGDKYGRENILVATIHRDETSPHLSAFVVPLTADKRLSAKEFIGNKTKMSEDQTTFADRMKDLGLQRGIKGSKAKHQTIREYYALASKSLAPTWPEITLPEPSLLESKAAYGAKVFETVSTAYSNDAKHLWARATTADKRIEQANREKELALKGQTEARNEAILQRQMAKGTDEDNQKLRDRIQYLQKTIIAGGQPLQDLHDAYKRQSEAPKKSISR
jgi:hypothetical protein